MRAGAVAVALIAALTVVPGLAPTPAAFGAPAPEPSASDELSGTLTLVASVANGGVLRPDVPLAVTGVLENGTSTADGPASLDLAIGVAPLPDRPSLRAWLAGESAPELAGAGSAAIDSVASGAQGAATIVVAADDPAIAGRGPGVYPVRVSTQIGGALLQAQSVLVVPDPAVGATVGVVVPIVAPPGTRGLLDRDTLAELTGEDGSLTAQLDAVQGTPAILAIDPSLPAAVRVLGTAAPESARAWLARLEELPNSRFALQFGDADLSTQVQAGLTTPLAPTSLVTYTSSSTLPPTPTPTPSASAGTAPSALPDLSQLLDIGPNAQAGLYWPATGTAGADVVAMLGAASVNGAPSLTLVSSAQTSAGAATTGARGTAGAAQLLVYDDGVSAALRRAADRADVTLRGGALAEASAYLAFATRESGGQPILVTVDRGLSRDRAGLRAAIQDAVSAPGVIATDLTSLAAATPAALEVPAVDDTDGRGGELTRLLSDEQSLASFATVLDEPALLTGRERAEILQLLAVSWRADADGAAAALADHRAQSRATLDAIGILPTSLLNLISYDAVFAPWIRNDLPWPARVTLVAQPNDPRLVVTQRTEVLASPQSNTRASIPVQSRIGSGAVSVTMQLYSPTGVPIGQVESADVEVRAEWETIGLAILIALMVLFVGLGVFRTVRRRRTRRRQVVELSAADLEPEVRSDDGASEHPQ